MLAVILLAGCGGDTRPALAPVSGTVTLDGRPLAEAIIVFTPRDGGRQSMGVTDVDGRYTLRYIRDVLGAKVGPHGVAITMASGARFRGPLPARYNSRSELRADVPPAGAALDFALAAP